MSRRILCPRWRSLYRVSLSNIHVNSLSEFWWGFRLKDNMKLRSSTSKTGKFGYQRAGLDWVQDVKVEAVLTDTAKLPRKITSLAVEISDCLHFLGQFSHDKSFILSEINTPSIYKPLDPYRFAIKCLNQSPVPEAGTVTSRMPEIIDNKLYNAKKNSTILYSSGLIIYRWLEKAFLRSHVIWFCNIMHYFLRLTLRLDVHIRMAEELNIRVSDKARQVLSKSKYGEEWFSLCQESISKKVASSVRAMLENLNIDIDECDRKSPISFTLLESGKVQIEYANHDSDIYDNIESIEKDHGHLGKAPNRYVNKVYNRYFLDKVFYRLGDILRVPENFPFVDRTTINMMKVFSVFGKSDLSVNGIAKNLIRVMAVIYLDDRFKDRLGNYLHSDVMNTYIRGGVDVVTDTAKTLRDTSKNLNSAIVAMDMIRDILNRFLLNYFVDHIVNISAPNLSTDYHESCMTILNNMGFERKYLDALPKYHMNTKVSDMCVDYESSLEFVMSYIENTITKQFSSIPVANSTTEAFWSQMNRFITDDEAIGAKGYKRPEAVAARRRANIDRNTVELELPTTEELFGGAIFGEVNDF